LDDRLCADSGQKKDILASESELVLYYEPAMQNSVLELQDLLFDNLLQYHGQHYCKSQNALKRMADGKLFSKKQEALSALRQFAEIVQEDLCFLDGPSSTLLGGLVCFPSRWNLRDKIGKNMAQIHQPVPNFASKLEGLVTKYIDSIPVNKPVERWNWTMHDSDEYFCPFPDKKKPEHLEEILLEKVFLRLERQTLVRLPKSQQVVFTIRTHIQNLASLPKSVLRSLREQIKSMPTENRDYKGMSTFVEPLLKGLQNI